MHKLMNFAKLKVVALTNTVLLDFGLEKDILCPFSEQKTKMEMNKYYIVFIYLDEKTKKLAASAKLEKFISNGNLELKNDEVDIMILNKSQLGYNAIVENKHMGLLYNNEVFSELKPGETTTAIVKKLGR